MISGSNEQLQQQLEYTVLKPVTAGEFQKCNLDQWHFQQDNVPVHNSLLVTDYLSKMSIKTVPQRPYSPDLTLCYVWLFPKLTGCRYEAIEEMKDDVTKVIDTLTREDFHGAFQKFLERYNKCIAAGGD